MLDDAAILLEAKTLDDNAGTEEDAMLDDAGMLL